MAMKTISLGNIPQGWFMSWLVTTQAGYNICVTLKDSAKVYVDNVCRQNLQPLPPLSQGFLQVAGSGLTLTVEASQSGGLQVVNQPFSVPDKQGNIVGQGYTILMEDATDADFNDVFVSIVAWRAER